MLSTNCHNNHPNGFICSIRGSCRYCVRVFYFILYQIHFCHYPPPERTGRFRWLYLKRRGLQQGSVFWGFMRDGCYCQRGSMTVTGQLSHNVFAVSQREFTMTTQYECWMLIQDIIGPATLWPRTIRQYFWAPHLNHWQRIRLAAFIWVNGLNPEVYYD
jgi:hypothetical protein